mmetsp:Transcript_27383/g.40124  ORF Transcript_27383/g.40124 Transcript_27383/m.40124 type:complete len:334 (-) Transcript_27383:135-1136(-)
MSTTTTATSAKTSRSPRIRRTNTMSDLQKEDKDHPSQRTVVGGEADDGFLEAISIGTGEFEAEETPLVKDDEDLEDDKEREHHRKMQVYYAKREMSPQQEQWNAITMIPNPFYCWYFIVAGHWFINASSSSIERNSAEDISGLCWTNSTWLPAAMPPLPLIAIALAITIHAPFSMLYHWKYAARLSAKQRAVHWSRKLDQCFIHIASALCSFGTSGSWDYFLVNVIFNVECCYRLMFSPNRPTRNQIRILISIIAYTIPILRRGEYELFGKCWAVLGLGAYLFAAYPLKGWSHAAFHIILCLLPPLLMEAGASLASSQDQVRVAAQCAALRMQ